MSVLEVKNLTHTYDGNTPYMHDAVKNVSFSIEKGEIIGIIGHTGSGKSTLVQHLNGLLKPSDGEILLDNKNIWENPKNIRAIRSRVGLVFQYPEYQLFEDTVYKDIAFGPKNMGLTEQEISIRIKEICELVGIKDEYLEKSPFDLSGGEKRRVAIAGVMAMQPEIIIFDEPVAGLDPMGRASVVKMIDDYSKKYNATVLIISHNMEDMALIADKLLVMNKGELALFDTTENVFRQHEYLKSIGLNVPMVTQIMLSLREKGINIPNDIFTVEKAVDYLMTFVKGGNHNA
ncbi:MAG: energy-coupling factor transporter ATPase [Clostridia bacterium]|nr:energy-coupling factor transporter ATPase [Clostridia bacterium]MBR3591905.1 energy-coupling factor transporter ATPase [Clostridia bacterium]MBR4116864.1 energy-coupling factor transporter ATPase [Clostridia bacterium]